jgi:hypothetical protein
LTQLCHENNGMFPSLRGREERKVFEQVADKIETVDHED